MTCNDLSCQEPNSRKIVVQGPKTLLFFKQVSRCFKQLNLSCQSLSADLRQNLLKRSKKKNFAKKPKKYHLQT